MSYTCLSNFLCGDILNIIDAFSGDIIKPSMLFRYYGNSIYVNRMNAIIEFKSNEYNYLKLKQIPLVKKYGKRLVQCINKGMLNNIASCVKFLKPRMEAGVNIRNYNYMTLHLASSHAVWGALTPNY